MSTGSTNSVAQEGLASVAHSIRRSAALYVAMSISEEGTTEAELLATADRLSLWILGRAGAPASTKTQDVFMGENPWQNPD